MNQVLTLLALALGLSSTGLAQTSSWQHLPNTAPRLAPFVHPAGTNASEVGLLLLCENGGFVPMLRLGANPALGDATRVWVETLHSDQLGAANYWQYDSLTHRAVPVADINGVIVAQVLFEGGTLRVRVSRHSGDPDVAIYNFGLDQFQTLRAEVPCLLSTAAPTHIDQWTYSQANLAVMGGHPDRTMVLFICRGPNQPAMIIRFAPGIDPQLSWMMAFIANVSPDAAFRFQHTANGQYFGDTNPAVRTLMHLTQDPPFPLVMLGSPAPFATLALGNLVEVLGNLPCIEVTRR